MQKVEINAIVSLEEEKRVSTDVNQFTIKTDGTKRSGGKGEYPTPILLMLSALLNCTLGTFRGFCEKREIATEGIKLEFSGDYGDEMFHSMEFTLHLPDDFPEKYKRSIAPILDTCTVKKAMRNLPDVELVLKE